MKAAPGLTGGKRQLASPAIFCQASCEAGPRREYRELLGEKSYQDTPLPWEDKGTEVSLVVGHRGYMVSVWNSNFQGSGKRVAQLGIGWVFYLLVFVFFFKLFIVSYLVLRLCFFIFLLQECSFEAILA